MTLTPKVAFLAFAISFGLCHAQDMDPSKWKPGQVLSETSEDMGFGFRLVEREVVNPASHWEGIGHFAFFYFREQQLCQCSRSEVSISPSGKYALLKDGRSGKLLLFTAPLNRFTEVTKKYVGSPEKFEWREQDGKATITLFQERKRGNKKASPITIALP